MRRAIVAPQATPTNSEEVPHPADELFEYWELPKQALTRPDFPTFYREVVDNMGLNAALFAFVQAWWPLRLTPGAMGRRGVAGGARDDGMTDEIADHLRVQGRAICTDETAFRWLYEGGPIG